MTLDILLVEDNPLSAELVQDLLEAAGHRVNVVADAASSRRALASDASSSVVLMDILLPDGDGVSLLHELRSAGRLVGKCVIALTAQALNGDAETFMAAGFAAVMTKPIDTRTFVAEVEGVAANVAQKEAQDGPHLNRR